MYYFFSPYYEVVVVIGLVLLALVAPSQFTARNTGTILYICWVFLGNLIVLINKLVWPDHALNIAPVLCDITVHFMGGLHYACVTTSIVINRRMFILSKISPDIATPAQRRKELIIELFIGLGIPAIGMCLIYVVQGHRGDIIQGLGCRPPVYNTPLTFALVWIWPCIFSLIAGTYGLLSLRAFLKRRDALEEFLNLHVSDLDADRYFRLMCFSAVQLTIAFPLGLSVILNAAINLTIHPWISWEDTHSNFDRFDPIPAAYVTSDARLYPETVILLWAVPFLSYLFFLFFGLGRERRNQYKCWLYVLLKPFGITPPAPKPCSTDSRTWWQKLLRRPASPSTTTNHGTVFTSSRGLTNLLPIFCCVDTSHDGNYPEPIPRARSRLPHITPFRASQSDISESKHHPEGMLEVLDIRALPASPSFVLETKRPAGLRANINQWTCPTCQNPRVGFEAGAPVYRERWQNNRLYNNNKKK